MRAGKTCTEIVLLSGGLRVAGGEIQFLDGAVPIGAQPTLTSLP